MSLGNSVLAASLAISSLLASALPQPAAVSAAALQVVGDDGAPLSRLTDGDPVRLRLMLPEPSSQAFPVVFSLEGSDQPVAECTILQGAADCESPAFATTGWYWQAGGIAAPSRSVLAKASDSDGVIAAATIEIAPRPVVMVHGFSSSWEAWVNYLGPSGYLAADGLAGFAVGDGQVPGSMNTGNLADPARRTNTIAENAALLGEYVDGVRRATGARTVDLMAHSMGGLISRYYIDRVMKDGEVTQLIMLGSPMAGTDCANLPAALGLYLPATLELRPSYVRQVFDPQIRQRHGVPFRALAGVPIVEGFKSPCTSVPTDLAVSLESVTAIPVESREMAVLHMDLNLSSQVYQEFVRPLLQTPFGGFTPEPDPPAAAEAGGPLQFSRVYTGHVETGASQVVTIPLDSGLTVASFALYDTTRSLSVAVTGASGKTIDLSAAGNGLVVVDDPTMLLYLGYGFENPKPGLWQVELRSSERTPSQGADFALTARFAGGAEMVASLSSLLPEIGDSIGLSASLRLQGADVSLSGARASVRAPDGQLQVLDLAIRGGQAQGDLQVTMPGLYGIDLIVAGTAPDGTPVERTSFLSLEAQPKGGPPIATVVWIGASIGAVALGGILAAVVRRRGKARAV
jgi:pimeloyl-ACP methyl ester carboxylesterase